MPALLRVRGRYGDLVDVPDPDELRGPVHHPLCDGAGRRRAADLEDAVPLLCRVCRPEAVAARARADRLALIGRPRR